MVPQMAQNMTSASTTQNIQFEGCLCRVDLGGHGILYSPVTGA